jgi:TusA-related sulfurtransferase
MRALILPLVFAGCASTASGPEPTSYPTPQSSLHRGMRNCPSALAGATTRVIDTEDGVDLEITATDPVVQRQIIELAIVHEHLGHPNGAEAAHTGMHGGRGDIGYCPIIHVGTMVTYRRRSDGAVIHVHALKPEAVSQMQKAITERVNLLATRSTLTAGRRGDT